MRISIKKSALFIGLAMGCITMAAQGPSAAYTPGTTQDAVSYWLPKTKVSVTVTTRKKSFTPGEFSRYAERYLRLSGVKDKAEEIWEITDITVSTYGVPDKKQLYTLTFPQKGKRPYFELTKDGIIASVNTRPLDEPTTAQSPTPAVSSKSDINPQDYLTEEILMAGSTAKMAELTAKEIYNIRESRNAITRGQADFMPTDGESVKYMLEALAKQETALLTLFNGTSDEEERIFTVDVNPDKPLSKQILFRFSTKLGVLAIDNLAGEPVWIDVTDMEMLSDVKQNDDSKKSKSKDSKGPFLYYRIPGRAAVKVYNNRKSFVEQEVQIAQFGKVETVSSTIMGKHVDTKITFDPNTGNIRSISE